MRFRALVVPVALLFVCSVAYAANITLHEPADNSLVNGTITLNATTSGVRTNASFYYDGNHIGTNYSTGKEFTLSWDSSAIPDGNYNIKVNVSNGDQITNTNITVDNHPPQITIEHPANTTYGYNTSLSLNFTLSEQGDWCGYSLDGAAPVTLPSCSNTTFDASEGAHSIVLSANDTLGNMNTSAVFFLIDMTDPSINSVSIDDNYVGDSDMFVVEANATDNFDTNLTVTETVFNSTDVILSKELQHYGEIYNTTNTGMNTSYAEGTYIINITATDDAGNSVLDSTLQFTLDNTAPNITSSGPSGTVSTSSTSLTVATDENAECRYSTSDDAFANMSVFSTTGGTSHSHGLSVSNSNSYLYYFRCRDPAENEAGGNISFSVNIPSPPAGGSSSPPITYKITWVDDEPDEEETAPEEPKEEEKEAEEVSEPSVQEPEKPRPSSPTGLFVVDPNLAGVALILLGVGGWHYLRKLRHKRRAKI